MVVNYLGSGTSLKMQIFPKIYPFSKKYTNVLPHKMFLRIKGLEISLKLLCVSFNKNPVLVKAADI